MVDSQYVLIPQVATIKFDLATMENQLNSFKQLTMVDEYSGLHQWTYETAEKLTPERKEFLNILVWMFKPVFYKIVPTDDYADFPAYMDAIDAVDPVKLRDGIIDYWLEHGKDMEPVPTQEDFLNDVDIFVKLQEIAWDETFNEEMRARVQKAHHYLQDAERTKREIAYTLHHVWNDLGLKQEWARVEPILKESVAAYSRLDYSNMGAIEAIRQVTGRDLNDVWGEELVNVTDVTFVPSPHIGPFVSYGKDANAPEKARFFFGVRMPAGIQSSSPEVNRSELLMRLNALSDNHRLTILDMLTREGELCAQDIIERLELSQSSVSRHLSQLSATGFVTERRKDTSKCYSLNQERISETINMLSIYLSVK